MVEEKKYNAYFNFCDEFENKEAELKYNEDYFKNEFLNTVIKYIIDKVIEQSFSSLSSFFSFKDYSEFSSTKIHTCWNVYKSNNQNIAFSFENVDVYSEYSSPIIVETMPKFYERIASVLKKYATKLYIEDKSVSYICDVNNGISIEFDTKISALIELIKTEIVNVPDYEIIVNSKIKDNYDKWLKNVYTEIFHKGFLDQFWKRLIDIYYSKDKEDNPSFIIKKSEDEEPLFCLKEIKEDYNKSGKYHYIFVLKISNKYYEYARDYIQKFIKEYFNYSEASDFNERMIQLLAGLNITIERFGDYWGEFNLDSIDRMQEMYSIEKKKLADINEASLKDSLYKKRILALNSNKRQS